MHMFPSTTHFDNQTKTVVIERGVQPDAWTRILLQNSLASSKTDAIGLQNGTLDGHPLQLPRPVVDSSINRHKWQAFSRVKQT